MSAPQVDEKLVGHPVRDVHAARSRLQDTPKILLDALIWLPVTTRSFFKVQDARQRTIGTEAFPIEEEPFQYEPRLDAALECLHVAKLIRFDGINIFVHNSTRKAVSDQMTVQERQGSWNRAILMAEACPAGLTGALLYEHVKMILDPWWLWSAQLDPPISICRLLLRARPELTKNRNRFSGWDALHEAINVADQALEEKRHPGFTRDCVVDVVVELKEMKRAVQNLLIHFGAPEMV